MDTVIKTIKLAVIVVFINTSTAQTGIGTTTPNASAKLEVAATNKGFLPPRIVLTSATDGTTIPSPATGLLIYNTATAGSAPNNVVPGYYYWNGTSWIQIANGLIIDSSKSSSFTLAATDNNKIFFINAASTVTVTVSNTLPIGFSCQFIQVGNGMITLLGSGVTLNSANGLSSRIVNSAIGLVMNTASVGYVYGDTIY
ncbi:MULTISPECIES: hypothetical protein [Flavobacterium]|uniref:Uncharacterized protein n=1 Tax=Flavobacterium keumense TaxID=1306518 RepID=A0ABY8N7V1_9FLAO|nr:MULTISPECIES: hypothetical protein [Flavobacterium]WGK95451.1 hypothetical protein MG292_04265 [Flavobacterium keumense]